MQTFIAYSGHEVARHCVEVEYMLDKESVFSQRSVGNIELFEYGEHPVLMSTVVPRVYVSLGYECA